MVSNQTIQELKNSHYGDKRSYSGQHSSYCQDRRANCPAIKSFGGERKREVSSQPVPNPKGQFVVRSSSTPTNGQEHVQAIVMLRSGKQVDNQVAMPEETPEVSEEVESQNKPARDSELSTTIPIIGDIPSNFVPKVSFPKRLMAPKKGSKFEDILEVFKQVQINIQFLDAIQQVPCYVKFLKDLGTIKKKTKCS
jgi:hypothetical protein